MHDSEVTWPNGVIFVHLAEVLQSCCTTAHLCSHLPRNGKPWRQQSQHREEGEPQGLAQGWDLSSKPKSALALLQGCRQVFSQLPLYWESIRAWVPFSSHILDYTSIKDEQCYSIKKEALSVHWRTSSSLVSGTTYITEVKGTEKLSFVIFVHPNVLYIHFQRSSKQHAEKRSNNALRSQGKEFFFLTNFCGLTWSLTWPFRLQAGISIYPSEGADYDVVS